MKISRWLLAGVAVLGLGVAFATYWQSRTPPEIVAARKMGAELSQKGRNGVPACVSCHATKGEGNAAKGLPRLAGLNAGYIARQLRDFGREAPLTGAHFDKIARDYSKTPRINLPYSTLTPGLRHDPVMSPIAKALKPDEIEALAQYYAAQDFVAKPLAGDPETLERGEDLALRGKPEYGVPGCFACHGQNAVGVGAVFPSLAGQPPPYIIDQLNRWQAGSRDNDENGLMRSVAEWMTEGDKQAIAAYLANLTYQADGR
jgi:cytochrome c553